MLVTGASRGIGAEIALGAAKENYMVIVNYAKQADDANHVVKQIISAGGQALAMQADCSKEEDIVRLFEQIDQIGTLDSFVANAGIIGGQNPVSQTTASQLKELFDINVIGLILCTREAVKRMSTELGGIGGKIVLMSSVAARTGGIAQEIHYASSKAAVDGFCLSDQYEQITHKILGGAKLINAKNLMRECYAVNIAPPHQFSIAISNLMRALQNNNQDINAYLQKIPQSLV